MQPLLLIALLLLSVQFSVHGYRGVNLQRSRGFYRTGCAATTVEVEFMPTGKIVTAKVGDSLSDIAAAAGVEIKYKCKKGECNTCEVNINGKFVKACQTKIVSADNLRVVAKSKLQEAKDAKAGTKKPKFFSPLSMVQGFYNNFLGMVGFVRVGFKSKTEFKARMEKEQRLAEKVAALKREKEEGLEALKKLL